MELYTPTHEGSRKKSKLRDERSEADRSEPYAAIRRGSRKPVDGLLKWDAPPPEDGKDRKEGEGATLVLTFPGGIEHKYDLAIVSAGGANYALSTPAQDIMIRIARAPAEYDDDVKTHEEEVQLGRELAALGICPAIFLDIRIRKRKGLGASVFPATAIERLHCSLADVQKCPVLTRKMFIEADGESMLVDLYTRASRVVRCIDTKPSNVVVNLYDDGTPPRIALIDVDTAHCWRLEFPDHSPRSPAGGPMGPMDPIEALDAYLHGLDMAADNIPLTPMLTTTLSLLVHVTVAAADYIDFKEDFGFPYPRITRVLLRRWGVVFELVEQDDSTADAADQAEKARDATLGVLPRLRDRTVRDEIRHYCGENAKKATDVICTWKNLDLFLRNMLELPASEILDVCRETGEPDLYEFLTAMLSTKTGPLTDEAYKVYKEDKEDKAATGKKRKAQQGIKSSSAEGLKQLLKRFAPKQDWGFTIPATCNRGSCKYHREPRPLVYPDPGLDP